MRRRLVPTAFLMALACVAGREVTEAADEPAAEAPLANRMRNVRALGAQWLLGHQDRRGDFAFRPGGYGDMSMHVGTTALVAYALASALHPDDRPRLLKAIAYLRRRIPRLVKTREPAKYLTCALSLTLLAFHRTYVGPIDCPTSAKSPRYGVPGWCKQMARDLAKRLLGLRAAHGLWGYPGSTGVHGQTHDVVNTHYALIGLLAAQRLGVKIEASMGSTARGLMRLQALDGKDVRRKVGVLVATPRPRSPAADLMPHPVDRARGFFYRSPPTRRGIRHSTTASALVALAVVKHFAHGKEPAQLCSLLGRALWDAVAHVGVHAGAALKLNGSVSSGSEWPYHRLWAASQARRLLGITHWGDEDWTRPGAEKLLAAQEPAGYWRGGKGGGFPHWDRREWVTALAVLTLEVREPPFERELLTVPTLAPPPK